MRGLLCHNKQTEEKQNIYSGHCWQQREGWLGLGIDWGQEDQLGHQRQSLRTKDNGWITQDRGCKEKEETLRGIWEQNPYRLVTGREARKETNVKVSSLRKEVSDEMQDETETSK